MVDLRAGLLFQLVQRGFDFRALGKGLFQFGNGPGDVPGPFEHEPAQPEELGALSLPPKEATTPPFMVFFAWIPRRPNSSKR